MTAVRACTVNAVLRGVLALAWAAWPGTAASQATTTERVSVSSSGEEGDAYSWGGAISGDGRFVFFESGAHNLVPGDTNNRDDVFVRDRLTRQTHRVSLTATGDQANNACVNASGSADGRYAVFDSWATNLVPGDTNGENDIFIRGPFDWPFFGDGFEYGDTAAWAVVVP